MNRHPARVTGWRNVDDKRQQYVKRLEWYATSVGTIPYRLACLLVSLDVAQGCICDDEIETAKDDPVGWASDSWEVVCHSPDRYVWTLRGTNVNCIAVAYLLPHMPHTLHVWPDGNARYVFNPTWNQHTEVIHGIA